MSLCEMNPGMVAAGIVEGSVAHVIASTWKYGNCYTNSIEIARALGLDPDAPSRPAPSPYRFTVNMEHDPGGTWWVYVDGTVQHGYKESMFVAEFRTEAEARSHAALVLAALHQATMEETP